ncbi:MAG TPA: alpha-D-ribose 1-methylphosphonate 5-triphosphate diphosphatase [Rhodocyclaceae bacterium]
MNADLVIRNARVLHPDGSLAAADVAIEGETIVGVGDEPASRALDAHGLLLLPGIVDLHGDAFERQLMPRPGVGFPIDLALLETDRQMAANGITTAFHGLTWSWEPGLRGREAAQEFFAALERVRGSFACDTYVHLRHEVYNIDAVEQIEAWLAQGRIRLLAFNDHLPLFERKRAAGQLGSYADRARVSTDAFVELMEKAARRTADVPAANARLAAAARRHGVPLASHDDETPLVREYYHELGCSLCEFPINRETAEAGRVLGNAVIMGAPNVVRGGSHARGMNAAEMVGHGLVDVLTSDYYYPSMLHAAFRLADAGIRPLGEAWGLVSARPARAGGFDDRGEIAPGRRADVLLVDDRQPTLPRVVATFVAGRMAYSARGWH